jgi:signal transduction histidine kinase
MAGRQRACIGSREAGDAIMDRSPNKVGAELDNLLMQAPALICILRGPEHQFELVNPLYAQLFPRRDLMRKTVREALPEMERQPYVDILDGVYRTGEPFVGKEWRAEIDRRGDGSNEEAFFNFIYQPMRDPDGAINGILVFAFEVSELVESRRRAETLATSLHRANREKDDFIAAISHELRTPLTSILGWTRMLKLGELDEETFQSALDAIERSTKAQAQLIDDLLDESRIAAGILRLDLRPLLINDVIEAAIETAAPTIEKHGVHLENRIAAEPMAVCGDPTRLQQIFNNLLSNAIKFTPRGGSVSVTLSRSDSRASIVVADTGRGIPADFLPYVFDRFRQDESVSSNDRRSGLGLGLSIVRHLAEVHGGTVRAASDGIGKGAAFTVELPLFSGTEPLGSLNDRDQDGRYAALPSLKDLKVLLVEDENDNRNVLQAVLLRCDAKVKSAATADEALAMILDWRPDVILADIMLPGRDGCQMLRDLRAFSDDEVRQTPAMALSVHGRANDRERALEAGYSIFRQKPIEPADLAFDIARLAHGKAGYRP